MLTTIGLENLKIECIIGELPHERVELQTIHVDVRLIYDSSRCVISDDISEAVNYVEIGDICKEVAIEGQYFLVETYVSEALDALLSTFNNQCTEVWMKVRKESGYSDADCATVEMKKEREE